MSALDAHQRSQLFLSPTLCLDNIFRAERHHHLVGMPRCLLVHCIDQVESALDEVAFVNVGSYPDGKELRTQISFLRFLQVDVALGYGSDRSDIEIFVNEALRSVRMSVDHNRRIMNFSSFG